MESPLLLGVPLLGQLCQVPPTVLTVRPLCGPCHTRCGGDLSAGFLSQVDLESILQSPGGKAEYFSEATALRAFSLHCRLSIHLQHKVRRSPPQGRAGSSRQQCSLLSCLSVVCLSFVQFCTEGKVYLSILEDTGFWLENKVLSFIQDQEEEYLKRHRAVYQQIIQVRILNRHLPLLTGFVRGFKTFFSVLKL